MAPDVREWTNAIIDVCGSDNIVQTEGFFWSSENSKADFKSRFDTKPQKSPHLPFCKVMNDHLFDFYDTKVVIVAGFEFRRIAIRQYGLKLVAPPTKRERLRGSLIEHYADERRRHWVFTLHWTNGYGFSNGEKAEVKSYVRNALDAARTGQRAGGRNQ
jgi:hypothetical protein